MIIKGLEKIEFNNFNVIKENENNFFLVFNNESYVINKDLESVIELFKKYKTIDNILKNNKNFEREFLIRAVNLLISIDCVSRVGNKILKYNDKKIKVGFLNKIINKKLANLFFSLPVKIILLILFITTAFIFLSNSAYVPNYKDFFFSENYLVCVLVAFAYGWISAFKHEFAHFLAAKSRGILSNLSVDTRLVFLVTQTSFNGVYKIKEEKRYRLYLSGIFADFLFLGIFLFFIFLNDQSIIFFSENIYLILKSFILIEFLAILWQFLFFMKTDLYYFIADYLDKENLLEDTKIYFKNLLEKKKQKKDSILFMFGMFFGFGAIVTVARFGLYMIPIKLKLIYSAFYYIFANAILGDINLRTLLSPFLILIIESFNITLSIVINTKKIFKKYFLNEK